MIDLTEHLEKRRRYALGNSLEQLIMAKNAPKLLKAGYLIKASHREVATLKLRFCLELKLTNETKIFQLQSKLEEIGRMLGGWLKSVQQ